MKNVRLTDKSLATLENIVESFQDIPTLEAAPFNHAQTLLLHIDIVEGFLNYGALHSKKVAKIVPAVVTLNEKLMDTTKVFVLDEHPEGAEEFDAYPPHCIAGSGESDLVQELLPFIQDEKLVFKKNSTNAFHAPGFAKWLEENTPTNIILVGDVTDICVLQAGLTLRTWFNEHNLEVRMIVPIEGVDTFDLEVTLHDADLHNLFALYNLRMNGLEIIRNLK